MVMEHLAGAGLGPTVRVMGGMTHLAAMDPAGVPGKDEVETVRATLLRQAADPHSEMAQTAARDPVG
jgi:hypothetical protein